MTDNIKQKRVIVDGAVKAKDVGDERRIVFVASSIKTDRDNEGVDVRSLRLPLKGGGTVSVSQIPEGGISDIVDVPLMLNHSGDVRDVIGSVRSAYYANNELIFEAGISSREVAQEMLTLIEEGHLSNAFSITMSDYDYDFSEGTISNAEVLEVSLVYRGSNKEARLLAVKSLAGDNANMADIQKQNDTFGEANGDGKEHPAEQTPEVAVETPETEATPEVEAKPEVKEAPEVDAEEKEEAKEEKEVSKSIATDMVAPKAATPVQTGASEGYLKTKAALADFRDVILKNHRGSNEQIMRQWAEHVKSKGVTGDAILPTDIENIFFKAWVDTPGILGTFRQVGARAGSVYAFITEDTALGHKKGETKKKQTLKNFRRDVKAKAVYKRLDIDLQDLFDDTTGELLKFRVEELSARVANAIAVGALLTAGTGNDATLEGTRGLYPALVDANDTNGFGSLVSSKINATGKDVYSLAVETIESVKDASNSGKILIVPEGFKKDLRLAKDNSGRLLLPIGMGLEELLGVKAIFELPELNKINSGKVKAIAYVDQSYVLFGESSAAIRTDFNLDTNQDVMLVERYVGGSAQGYKTVAVAALP